MMSLPSNIVYYVGYESLRDFMSDQIGSQYSPLLAGASARGIRFNVALAVTFISPLELLRTRVQAGEKSMTSILGGVGHMIRQRGIQSLWTGLPITLWRDVPFSAIYWTFYEGFKRYEFSESTFLNAFVGGSLAGLVIGLI